MILVPFFASSTGYGSTKNLLSLPFQAPVFFGQLAAKLRAVKVGGLKRILPLGLSRTTRGRQKFCLKIVQYEAEYQSVGSEIHFSFEIFLKRTESVGTTTTTKKAIFIPSFHEFFFAQEMHMSPVHMG